MEASTTSLSALYVIRENGQDIQCGAVNPANALRLMPCEFMRWLLDCDDADLEDSDIRALMNLAHHVQWMWWDRCVDIGDGTTYLQSITQYLDRLRVRFGLHLLVGRSYVKTDEGDLPRHIFLLVPASLVFATVRL